MQVREVKLECFQESAYCDCGGLLEFGGIVLTSNPPQYPFKCTVCGKTETLREHYPRISYREAK